MYAFPRCRDVLIYGSRIEVEIQKAIDEKDSSLKCPSRGFQDGTCSGSLVVKRERKSCGTVVGVDEEVVGDVMCESRSPIGYIDKTTVVQSFSRAQQQARRVAQYPKL